MNNYVSIDEKLILRKVNDTSGWFVDDDQILFIMLFEFFNLERIIGNTIEIGVYKGKSAILLNYLVKESEDLYLCDIFDKVTTEVNRNEIEDYYDSYSETGVLNTIKLPNKNPKILNCNSIDLKNLCGELQFKFIHVDGSHLYEIVSKDVAFVTEGALMPKGIVVFDDYRTVHTIGVSAAIWEAIVLKKLKPIIRTENKLYCVNHLLPSVEVEKIFEFLKIKKIDFLYEEYLGHEAVFIKLPKTES
jgi:hypothetical protein